jgi:hypothetical protein
MKLMLALRSHTSTRDEDGGRKMSGFMLLKAKSDC